MSDNRVNKAHEIRAEGIKKTIRFRTANLNVEIRCPYGSAFQDYDKYLKKFDKPDISFEITQEEAEALEAIMKAGYEVEFALLKEEAIGNWRKFRGQFGFND